MGRPRVDDQYSPTPITDVHGQPAISCEPAVVRIAHNYAGGQQSGSRWRQCQLHFGTLAAAWLVRLGVIRDLARHAPRLRRISEWFLGAGSDVGGMVVELGGRDAQDRPLRLRWSLSAAAGHGPQIPATPAVVLARMLADGRLPARGAVPCVGLFTLDDALAALDGFAVETGLATLTT